jgi:predicted metal-dependent hydrolase
MTAKVVQFKQIGRVTFTKNRRSKNIKISVKPDQSVQVSFPFYTSSAEAALFVQKNLEWIQNQQKKFQTNTTQLYEGLQMQTKLHKIVIQKGGKNKTLIHENLINVEVEDFGSDVSRTYFENILDEVYRFEAKRILPVRLYELAEQFGFIYNKVTIRNNKRNWGSCSAKNNISLNLQMMKMPNELIDYILLHELVHTKIKNHGPKFWEKLNELTGNRAKKLAKQVRQYSTYTL